MSNLRKFKYFFIGAISFAALSQLYAADTSSEAIFYDDFSNVNAWVAKTHQDGKSADIKKYNISFEKGILDGHSAGVISYNYSTPGEDAVMISRDVSILKGDSITVSLKGDGCKHSLFVIFEDVSGEKHFLPMGIISLTEPVIRKVKFNSLLESPGLNIEPTHYGGDKNQKIDFPIKKITIGISDEKDDNKNSGKVFISNIKIE